MANTHPANQLSHMPGLKNVAYEAIVFPKVNSQTITRHNAGSVLASVLNHCQCFINGLIRFPID